jgi:hypothetical protein
MKTGAPKGCGLGRGTSFVFARMGLPTSGTPEIVASVMRPRLAHLGRITKRQAARLILTHIVTDEEGDCRFDVKQITVTNHIFASTVAGAITNRKDRHTKDRRHLMTIAHKTREPIGTDLWDHSSTFRS